MRKTVIRPLPADELPPPRVQCISHTKANATEPVTEAPARLMAPICGASGVGKTASPDCPCIAWPRYEWAFKSCDATIIYRNRSKNLALSARPSLELTAFYSVAG